MFSWFRRKKKSPTEGDGTPKRIPISGTVRVGNREWTVTEEKRAGPYPQLLVLRAVDSTSEMHVRTPRGSEAHTLDEVEPLAMHPAYRWFDDDDGVRWEARTVISESPHRVMVKFISWTAGVFEGEYPHEQGLGFRSDDELCAMLRTLRDGAGET